MKYNNKQRAKIYLEFAKSINPKGELDFICHHLFGILYGRYWGIHYRHDRSGWKAEFPEFALFEDNEWKVEWSFENNSERIIALLFCYHMALEAKK